MRHKYQELHFGAKDYEGARFVVELGLSNFHVHPKYKAGFPIGEENP